MLDQLSNYVSISDPIFDLNGKNLDLSGANVQLELGTGLVLDGISTGENTELLLTANSVISRNSPFTFGNINLQNKALTLGSETSDMTVSGAITFDTSSSQVLTGEADLILQSTSGLDIVNSINNAVELKKSGIYNIATGESISIKKLAEKIINISRKDLKVLYFNPKNNEIKFSQASIESSKKDLKYIPKVSLDKGIAELLEN